MNEPEQDALEHRVVELEIKLAYQDRLLADLDAVLRDFTARVQALTARVERLEEAASAGDAEAVGPANEPPPHY